LENTNININYVIERLFGGEFSLFCKHKKGPSSSTKYFLTEKINKNFNDIILQWLLGLIAKKEKYFNKFILPYTSMSIAKTWLYFIVDDFEEHQKFEKSCLK
jgi:hypothetical protein